MQTGSAPDAPPQTRQYLGVDFQGIQILSYPNKAVVGFHRYTDICQWSSSSQQFSVAVGQTAGEPVADVAGADAAAQSNITFPFFTTQVCGCSFRTWRSTNAHCMFVVCLGQGDQRRCAGVH
jgi:hypothetical protein